MDQQINIQTENEEQPIATLTDQTTGKQYVIPYRTDQKKLLVGRKKKQDVIPDIEIETDDTCMSGKQAYIWIEKNIIGEYSLFIQDTDTRTNKSLVNEIIIDHTFKFQVYDKDVINLGETDFKVCFNPTIQE